MAVASKSAVQFQSHFRSVLNRFRRPRPEIASVMLGANEVTALPNGAFRIHSLDIQLEPRSAKFPSFRGPGSIRQNTSGQLIFELYDTNANPTFGRHPGEGAPGGLVPDDQYYRLTAVDQGGRRWTADRILPRYSVGGAGSAAGAGAGSVCGG